MDLRGERFFSFDEHVIVFSTPLRQTRGFHIIAFENIGTYVRYPPGLTVLLDKDT